MSISKSVADAIKAAYVEYDVPADRITTDSAKAATFTDLVNAKLGGGGHLSTDQCMKDLLTLRRRGGENDGLPRLRAGHGPKKGGPKNGYGPKAP